MSKFMYSGNYTRRGVKGLLKDGGSARKEETVRLVESLGGSAIVVTKGVLRHILAALLWKKDGWS